MTTLDRLKNTRGRLPFGDLERPGLVVLDVQRLFCEPGAPAFIPAWQEAQPNAARLSEAFRRRGLPVLHTRHVHPPGDGGGLIGRFFGRLQRATDPWTDLLPEAVAGDVVEKGRHSALSAPAVREALADCETLVVAGVQTPLCVLATALDAARFGLVPIVVADATAARHEADHEAALRVLAAGHAHVATTAEVLARWGTG